MTFTRLTSEQIADFVSDRQSTRSISLDYEERNHAIVGFDNNEKVFDLRLPLPYERMRSGESIEGYLKRVTIEPFAPYLVLLIQAGHAALGSFEKGEVLRHKVLRSYMVRKGQGRSQLSFSKNGRGNSAGSQLRYRNAIRFFEDINRTLREWKMVDRCERILYSCPINLWGFLHNSKIDCPFDGKDARLQKIPLDIRVPNFDELLRVNRSVSFGYVTHYGCDKPDIPSHTTPGS